MAQTPVYDLTQNRSAWLVEACGEVIHFLPCCCVQAGIHAAGGLWLGGGMIRLDHRDCSVSMPHDLG